MASKFYEAYQKALEELHQETMELIESGSMSQEDAEFREWMLRDEILESMPFAEEGCY